MAQPGSKKLADFLMKLGNDSKLLNDFKRDPEGTMNAATLSDDEKNVVKSGDPAKIRAAISGDSIEGDVVVVVVVVIAA